MCLEQQHAALGAEGGHLSPPHGMRNREDETTKKEAAVQTQAEMESVCSLAPASLRFTVPAFPEPSSHSCSQFHYNTSAYLYYILMV